MNGWIKSTLAGGLLLFGSSCTTVAPEDFTPQPLSALNWGFDSKTKFVPYESGRLTRGETTAWLIRVQHEEEPSARGTVTVNFAKPQRNGISLGNVGGPTAQRQVNEEGHRDYIADLKGAVMTTTLSVQPNWSRETTFQHQGNTCILVGSGKPDPSLQRYYPNVDTGYYTWAARGVFCGPLEYRQEFSRYVRFSGFSTMR